MTGYFIFIKAQKRNYNLLNIKIGSCTKYSMRIRAFEV